MTNKPSIPLEKFFLLSELELARMASDHSELMYEKYWRKSLEIDLYSTKEGDDLELIEIAKKREEQK